MFSLSSLLRASGSLTMLAALASPGVAFAEPVPGDACNPDGISIMSNNGGETNYMVCNGGTWISILSTNGFAELNILGLQDASACGAGTVIKSDGSTWQCMAEGAGGSSLFERSGTVVRPSSAVTISTDDFVFGSRSMDDVVGTDDDRRMFFDKSKAAFRAGRPNGLSWNDASIGDHSAAFGSGIASGGYSFAAGGGAAQGNNSVAFGDAQANSDFAFAFGTGVADAEYSTAWGGDPLSGNPGGEATGQASTAWGILSYASGGTATAWGGLLGGGSGGDAQGQASTAFGSETLASGDASTAFGWATIATGDTSTAWGYYAHAGSYAETSLGRYPLNTAGTIGSWVATDVLFEIGNGADSSNRANALTLIKNGNFVVGSHSLDDVTGTSDDSRMFFDKAKGALRAGTSGVQWDNGSRGTASAAFGQGTTASGNYSMAWGISTAATGSQSTAGGTSTTASGGLSTAFGNGTTASGSTSTSFGQGTIASGTQSMVWGSSATAAGSRSTAWGLGGHAGSYLETSMGQYPLAATANGTSWVATDVLLEVGNGTSAGARANALTLLKNGNLGVGTAAPQSTLHVPDGNYLQVEDNNAGAPPAGDCDADTERGRISLDTSNNRIYVCMGAARGWDYATLTD